VASAPQFNAAPQPALRDVLNVLLKNVLGQTGASAGKLDMKSAPTPALFKPLASLFPSFPQPQPPPPQFPPFPPGPPMPPGPPVGPPATGGGVFMDLPNTGPGGYAAPMMRSYQYCPPGPTSNDACKNQKLMEALYHPDGTPRYNWVPPRNPWDSSIPDTVKDTAQNILMMKVNSRPNRTPTAKEWELMSLLGDPKEQSHMANNPFAMAGGPPHAYDGSIQLMVAQYSLWWLNTDYGGSKQLMVAQYSLWWLNASMVAEYSYGGSIQLMVAEYSLWWLNASMVAEYSYGGSIQLMVAEYIYGG
ncbi:hypothetical protein Btru_015972, partial [Bulinus truncatus]